MNKVSTTNFRKYGSLHTFSQWAAGAVVKSYYYYPVSTHATTVSRQRNCHAIASRLVMLKIPVAKKVRQCVDRW